MNISIIRRILGYVLLLEAALLLVPFLVGLIYREKESFAYIIVALICVACGSIMAAIKPKNQVFYLKDGCVATAMSWIALSLFGCLPFLITKEIPRFIDALFETVSGFTTTGTTIINDVEIISHASLIWRSLTHWVGGMGVLVFIMAVVPLSGGSNIHLMKAESPGPSVGKIVPKMRQTARWLYMIYVFITFAEFVFLLTGGMSVFEAFATATATAGTGGFGVKNSSIGGYSPYIQWGVTVFMILFGINFNAYYFIIMRHFKKALAIEEIKVYFGVVVGCSMLIFFNIYRMYPTAFEALTHSFFQVAAVITTTGFTTTDFDTWPALSKTLLVLLMFVGACAGSTGGGIKISRYIIVVKSVGREIKSFLHPKSVNKVKMDKKILDSDVIRTTNIYFITFIMIFVVSLLLVSIEGRDLTTNFTAVASEMNNIGPGLSTAGPTENFYSFTVLSKFVFIFDMLAGRLELFPMLMLFHPVLWKDTFKQNYNDIKKKNRKAIVKDS
jgi:trk system potassium uptake protein TrkH